MENQEKTQKITQQIFDDAQRKGSRIIKKAKRDVSLLTKDARKQAELLKENILADAAIEAEKTYEKILSTIPLEENRILLKSKNKIVTEILAQLKERLVQRKNFDYEKALKNLIISAIKKMPVDNFVLSFAELDKHIFSQDFINEIEQEIEDKLNRKIKIEISNQFEEIIGGVRIRDKSGRLFYDNSFDARLVRLHHLLREKIAEIIF